MKKSLDKNQEGLLTEFENYIEAGCRDVPFFCKEFNTTPRNLSYILSIVHETTIQDFLTEYSNCICGHNRCVNFVKYKVTGHKYDTFCSTECRYKTTHSNYKKNVSLDNETELIKEMIVQVQESKKISPSEKRRFLESTDMELDQIKKIYSELKQSVKKRL